MLCEVEIVSCVEEMGRRADVWNGMRTLTGLAGERGLTPAVAISTSYTGGVWEEAG